MTTNEQRHKDATTFTVFSEADLNWFEGQGLLQRDVRQRLYHMERLLSHRREPIVVTYDTDRDIYETIKKQVADYRQYVAQLRYTPPTPLRGDWTL